MVSYREKAAAEWAVELRVRAGLGYQTGKIRQHELIVAYICMFISFVYF